MTRSGPLTKGGPRATDYCGDAKKRAIVEIDSLYGAVFVAFVAELEIDELFIGIISANKYIKFDVTGVANKDVKFDTGLRRVDEGSL